MAEQTTYTGIRGEWRDLITPLAGYPGLENLEPFRAKLETFLDRATDLTVQQGALTADKQDLSRQLRIVMGKGQRVAALLRKALREHFGTQAEQLVAFGLQPFRGRRPNDPIEPPPVPEVSKPGTDTDPQK